MPDKLPADAALPDVVKTLKQPRVYFANVLQAMKKGSSHHETMLARIGVQGNGTSPNFRVENADGSYKKAYDGVTFSPFAEPKTHDPNWSLRVSTYAEVEALVIEQRDLERRKPR